MFTKSCHKFNNQ